MMRAFLIWLCFMAQASAEKLIPALSSHRVVINSNFSGADLVLFGMIERDASTVGRSGLDIAVVMRGVEQSVILRQKKRQLGLWINGAALPIDNAPTAFMTLTSRKIIDIADKETRVNEQIGMDGLFKKDNSPQHSAFLRLQRDKLLYRDFNNGVIFLTPTWFRARLPLPSQTPVGQYRIDVYLLSGGVIIARAETNFEVVKAGIEQFISSQAEQRPWGYGLVVALIALFSGFIAHMVFKRD